MVPPPTLPLTVKNTFIDVDKRYIEDPFESDEEPIGVGSMRKRQVTEPCPARRQFTPVNNVTACRDEVEPRVTDDDSMGAHFGLGQASNSVEAPNDVDGMPLTAMPDFYSLDVCQGWMPAGLVQLQMPCVAFGADATTTPGCGTELQELPADWGNTLTVMMRNLPNKYTQHMLLEEINSNGFDGTYDFLYLPIDPETGANRGYAFINFVDSARSWTFKSCYEGRQIGHFNSGKVITVMPATLQGFDANHAHYASARVSRGDPSTRPLFLRQPSAGGVAWRQAPPQSQGRRRGRMSLIDVAAQKAFQAAGQSSTCGSLPSPWLEAGGCENSASRDVEVSTVSFCPYCGGKVGQTFRFCQFCGASLSVS